MTIKILGLGVKFAGTCVKCNEQTDDSDRAKATETMLCRKPDGKFGVCHVRCTGGRAVNKVSGAKQYNGPSEIEC